MHIAILLFKLKTYSIYKALLLLNIVIDIDIGIKFAYFIDVSSLKIAIACREERISPVFDVSNTICLVEIDGVRELRRLIWAAVSHVFQIALSAAGVQAV